MAEFSGKIINAEYMDAEYSIIKVQYDKDGKIFVYNLDVDPNHPDFQALEAEGWDTEKLVEATAESKRMQAAAWNIEINNAAKSLIAQAEKENPTPTLIDTNSSEVYEHVVFDKDKDNLFKFKLWALETDIFKAATKTQKSSLRKSKSILEGLALINTIKNK